MPVRTVADITRNSARRRILFRLTGCMTMRAARVGDGAIAVAGILRSGGAQHRLRPARRGLRTGAQARRGDLRIAQHLVLHRRRPLRAGRARPAPAAHLLRGDPPRPRPDHRAVRGPALPVLRQLLRVRQLLWRLPRQRGRQAGPGETLRIQRRLLQGLRHLRRRMPLRCDPDGAGDDLRPKVPGVWLGLRARRISTSRRFRGCVLRLPLASGVTAMQRNIPLPSLQRPLGHDHLGTSQIYLNLSPEEVIREFNEKWCGACSWRLEVCRMIFGFGPRRGPSHEERQLRSRSLQLAEAVRIIPR